MGSHHKGTCSELRALNAYVKLIRAANSVGARLERRLNALGLTENQFGVLEIILHLGPVVQRELGQKLFTTGGNVTQILDQLEERGLVVRARDLSDRRQIKVSLTEKGRQFITRIFPDHVRAIADEFSVLTAAEQEELARLCKKVGLQLADPEQRSGLGQLGE